jgi:hypothetical protein
VKEKDDKIEKELRKIEEDLKHAIAKARLRTDIVAEMIDQDAPDNKTWVKAAKVLYGGSIASTADNLRLSLFDTTEDKTDPPVSYAWSVSGHGGDNYPKPGNTAVWDVGDLKPVAGTLIFVCDTKFQSGASRSAYTMVEVGIRSDDTVMVGWIDKEGVNLPKPDGRLVKEQFPADGVVPALQQPLSLFAVARFSKFYEQSKGGKNGYNNNDRLYLLNWLFKYADNPNPKKNGAADFLSGGTIDYSKVKAFREKKIGGYKLFNHYQVKFQVHPNVGAYDLFRYGPQSLRDETGIGWTPDPITHGLPGPHPGQKGPKDGFRFRVKNERICQINDGSPDANGINVLNELVGDTRHAAKPIFWENIGSKITFTPKSAEANLTVQPYPTYYWYRNGTLVDTGKKFKQADEPTGNFVAPDFIKNTGGP